MPYLPTYVWPGQCAYVDFSLSQPMFPQSAMAETVLGSRQNECAGLPGHQGTGCPRDGQSRRFILQFGLELFGEILISGRITQRGCQTEAVGVRSVRIVLTVKGCRSNLEGTVHLGSFVLARFGYIDTLS